MGIKRLFKKVGDKSLEYASRMGNQTHLSMLRDTFAMMTPLIIVGALAILIRTFVFGGAGATQTSILGWIGHAVGAVHIGSDGSWSFIAGTTFEKASHIGNFLFYGVSHGTIDVMSIYVAFGIGFFLTGIRGEENRLMGGLVSLAAFFIATLAKPDLLDAKGLITAIVVGIISTEAFAYLSKSKKLLLKMPKGVPPAVARSFAKLFPAMIILVSVLLLNLPFVLIGVLKNVEPTFSLGSDNASFVFGDALFLGIQAPFMKLIGTENAGLGLAIVFMFFVSLLWFFGLHGSNILMGVMSPIYLGLYAQNVHGANHIFVQGTFDAFIMIGGTGATLGLIVAVMIFGRKEKTLFEISKLGVGPGIFQINEPILFGVPIVLSAKYAIPFIFAMPILTITTWIGFKIMDIHPVTIMIPWTAPVGIGGLLATGIDWKGFVLAFINFGISFAIWLPFVIIATSQAVKLAKTNKKIQLTEKVQKDNKNKEVING